MSISTINGAGKTDYTYEIRSLNLIIHQSQYKMNQLNAQSETMKLLFEDRGERNAMKKSSASLTVRELAIKTAVEHHLTPARSTVAEETK